MFKIILTAVVVALITSAAWRAHMENIIVAKASDFRFMEITFAKRLHDSRLAYDDAATLHQICEKERRALASGGSAGQRTHNGNRVMMDVSSNHGQVDRAKPR